MHFVTASYCFSHQQITRDDTDFLSRSVFLSHADSNENDNENCLRNVALNLTQTSQNSQNNISEQDNQRELDTITQNTHCFARVGRPDGDSRRLNDNDAENEDDNIKH